MKIAIIGSGISGLTCAYLLQQRYDITVFEAAADIGGHTATKTVNLHGRQYPVDTGFIVFNDRTYPTFIRLLDQLGVESLPTDMSFSVSCEQTGLEYNGTSLNGLFAQRRNLANPYFWGMLKDIVRFNRQAQADLDSGAIASATTLGEYLARHDYGEYFTRRYLLPMGAAIWSASSEGMLEFPLLFFVRFFKNHGLLSINDRPQWRVIKGGSRSYLDPLTEGFRDKIMRACPVTSVRREAGGAVVATAAGSQAFDQVVFACHSDQALALLADPSAEEVDILGRMDYRDNDVVLHTDTRLLPKRPLAWACWNYRIKQAPTELATLSYNMNMLQGIDAPETFCVTLNDTAAIDPDKILGRYNYSHPVFSLASTAAAQRWQDINGVNSSWYCGAYWANGFHEDGCNSAVRVAAGLGVDW
ncbi:FAD-dependent oxidoreductase [Pseudomaricurvus alcaniphilus]|uniref:NAD(P)/FAD-dependent oxidoreductase n=1 Tax=Pseudomaricurvus alcaniphilus TaxID=1166482 RepID=UPI00140A3A95|nr:FAD-dependent oxidoreductase [Pseudomaricurvus alcaniphilus]NHN36097.1 FAD-dependent oxidoreductase [Pseudomaricurvus alcaniphilus]